MDEGTQSDELTAAAPRDSSNPETIGYRKFRAPRVAGRSLQVPPLSSVDRVWGSNLAMRCDNAGAEFNSIPLADFQVLARAEVVKLAREYSSTYLDEVSGLKTENIVMAGHQPELFHPGVWYKNFVLSNLGKRFDCTAINLVVDNDICGNASIRFPKVEFDDSKSVTLGSIPIDSPGPSIPFEARAIQDWSLFEKFGERSASAIARQVDSPIVAKLWPHVIDAANRIWGERRRQLGPALAAGRHRLEFENGLRTLEVPISSVAKTKSFAMFTNAILSDPDRFRIVYNQALLEYRNINGIRSNSHPVPELESLDGWIETPFWVWQANRPNRKRLFTMQTAHHVVLSDRSGWEERIELAAFVEQFRNLAANGIAIRPKALMTTMFSRMFLCDLFLHGIGGAKYDQLTDAIAAGFFSIQLPRFMTLSATLKLPSKFELIKRGDIVAIEQQMRELKFHPESLISKPSAEVEELVSQKQDWTTGKHRATRSKEKHLAIEALNRQLATFVDVDSKQLESARASAMSKIRSSEILDSREYSFCLFPESLIGELKSLADE